MLICIFQLIGRFLEQFHFKSEADHSIYTVPPLIPQRSPLQIQTRAIATRYRERERERAHGGEGEEPAKPAVAGGAGREAKPALQELLRPQPQPLLLRRRRSSPPAAAASSPSTSSGRRPPPPTISTAHACLCAVRVEGEDRLGCLCPLCGKTLDLVLERRNGRQV